MDVHELKDRARAMVVKGRLEKAEVLYRQVVTLVPGDAPAWIRHAETLKRLNRIPEAVWSYRTAANILRSLGHEGRALACLKIALEFKPDDIDLITEIIRIEMHRKRRVEKPQAAAVSAIDPPIGDLEKPKLALPMLTEIDPRQSADSVVVRAPDSAPTEPAGLDPTGEVAAPAPRSPEGELGAPPTAAEASRAPDERVDVRPAASAPRPPPPARATPAPVELEVQLGQMPVWPQVRRIHDREVAIKGGPTAKWVVISSKSPLEVRFETKLAIDEDAPWLE